MVYNSRDSQATAQDQSSLNALLVVVIFLVIKNSKFK